MEAVETTTMMMMMEVATKTRAPVAEALPTVAEICPSGPLREVRYWKLKQQRDAFLLLEPIHRLEAAKPIQSLQRSGCFRPSSSPRSASVLAQRVPSRHESCEVGRKRGRIGANTQREARDRLALLSCEMKKNSAMPLMERNVGPTRTGVTCTPCQGKPMKQKHACKHMCSS